MDAVKTIRKERGWSQQRLAEEAGVNKVTLVHIETGKSSPNVETLEKLASALGVELADFFPKAQAPLPFEDAGERGEEQRRHEQPSDEQLAFSLNYERRVMETDIKSYRGFLEDLLRRGELPGYDPDRILGGALWHSVDRVDSHTGLLSEAERVLAASEAGEVVPDRLKTRAEEFMETFLQLGEVGEELAQTTALLQGHELGPGDPAGIFAHSKGPNFRDLADDWKDKLAEQSEDLVKDHDA